MELLRSGAPVTRQVHSGGYHGGPIFNRADVSVPSGNGKWALCAWFTTTGPVPDVFIAKLCDLFAFPRIRPTLSQEHVA